MTQHNIDDTRLFNLDKIGATSDKDFNTNMDSKWLSARNGCKDMKKPDFKYKDRVVMLSVNTVAMQHLRYLFWKRKRCHIVLKLVTEQ